MPEAPNPASRLCLPRLYWAEVAATFVVASGPWVFWGHLPQAGSE